nr:MAG TPA: hypothetical protein [Caudoviricetes sp.]
MRYCLSLYTLVYITPICYNFQRKRIFTVNLFSVYLFITFIFLSQLPAIVPSG